MRLIILMLISVSLFAATARPPEIAAADTAFAKAEAVREEAYKKYVLTIDVKHIPFPPLSKDPKESEKRIQQLITNLNAYRDQVASYLKEPGRENNGQRASFYEIGCRYLVDAEPNRQELDKLQKSVR